MVSLRVTFFELFASFSKCTQLACTKIEFFTKILWKFTLGKLEKIISQCDIPYILTMTANSEQHRQNNKCFLGVWHSIAYIYKHTPRYSSINEKENLYGVKCNQMQRKTCIFRLQPNTTWKKAFLIIVKCRLHGVCSIWWKTIKGSCFAFFKINATA